MEINLTRSDQSRHAHFSEDVIKRYIKCASSHLRYSCSLKKLEKSSMMCYIEYFKFSKNPQVVRLVLMCF